MYLKKITAFLLLFFVTPFCLAKSDYMFACIDDYPPYQFLDPTPHGIHITALKKIAQIFNKEIRFIESPNIARCVRMLKNGEVDVIAGLNINKEREEFAFYAPYKREESHVVISNKSLEINDYQSLQGKIIGVPRGTTYFKKFNNDSTLKKIPIPNVRVGIELIARQRIDVVITASFVAKKLLADMNHLQLKTTIIKKEDNEELSYFGFSKLNKLGLSQNEIIDQTTQAFKQGRFVDNEKVSNTLTNKN